MWRYCRRRRPIPWTTCPSATDDLDETVFLNQKLDSLADDMHALGGKLGVNVRPTGGPLKA